MDLRHPNPSNTQTSTTSYGVALQLTGGTPYLPNPTRLLYQKIQTCRVILVPILLEISGAATSGTFVLLTLTCVYMPQRMGLFRSTEME